jgi:hypothetical protein
MSAHRTAAHLASFARFLARRDARERTDTAAQHDLANARLPLAPGLEIEWLGTAGYRLIYSGQTLLIDPYLTRVPLKALRRREPALADPALHSRYLREHSPGPGRRLGRSVPQICPELGRSERSP